MTTTAHCAQSDLTWRKFALSVHHFTNCTVYDFADGSYLVAHHSGRTEVNTYNP
jgi:hypothetical protein